MLKMLHAVYNIGKMRCMLAPEHAAAYYAALSSALEWARQKDCCANFKGSVKAVIELDLGHFACGKRLL